MLTDETFQEGVLGEPQSMERNNPLAERSATIGLQLFARRHEHYSNRPMALAEFRTAIAAWGFNPTEEKGFDDFLRSPGVAELALQVRDAFVTLTDELREITVPLYRQAVASGVSGISLLR